jgi:hypothetical protein
VDLDTVHNPAEPTTTDELSADRRDGGIVGNYNSSKAQLQDAVRSSRSPGNASGDRYDANIKLAVQLPRNQRSYATEVGGQNESPA